MIGLQAIHAMMKPHNLMAQYNHLARTYDRLLKYIDEQAPQS